MMCSDILRRLSAAVLAVAACCAAGADTVPDGAPRVIWHAGATLSGAYVPQTNTFLRGENPAGERVRGVAGVDLRGGFGYGSGTRVGRLYRGVYQGIGLGVRSYFHPEILGTPGTAYVYQGAPIVRFNGRMWIGYEWQFGVAYGWKHAGDNSAADNSAVSTSATALIGLGLRLHYQLTDNWRLSVGLDGTHYSNGNTTYPNPGVNSVGLSVGLARIINPEAVTSEATAEEICRADRRRWFYDIMVYGAWRRRVVRVDDQEQLCPGRFGVAGLQFSPLLALNRYVAVGPALDLQWDESAGLAPYHVEGTWNENIKFRRPPFGKQLSAGVSAHAELTMPIFAVNVGLGCELLNPEGDKRFYQSLALKTFVTRRFFLNVGYRLGNFKDPQNLMLGVGVRL